MTVLREDGLDVFLKRQLTTMNGVLIHGSDSATNASIGRQVARAVFGKAPGEAERFDASVFKEGMGRFEDEFLSLSLLGDRRVLWVDDVGDSHLKSLTTVLGFDRSANFVILIADTLGKNSKLRVAAEESAKFASLAIYEENLEATRSRLGALASANNMRWADGAVETFLEIVGNDRAVVVQEFEKLSLYCLTQPTISSDDVLAVCGDTAAFGSDELIDAMLLGDLGDVDRMLSNLDSDGGGARVILVTALSHLTRLQELRAGLDGGTSADMAVRNARPPIFFKRQSAVSYQLRKFSADDLLAMQQSMAAAILQTRKFGDLGDQITSRTLLSMARLARSKST